MDKIQDIPDISTELNIDKIAKIKEISLISKAKDISSKRFNIIHYIKNNSKSWFGLAFSIGITAAFMGLSISTHNMELFSPKSSIYPTSNLKSNANGLSLSNADEEKQINRYLNAHQKSDTHAYGLVNIASSEDSEDNYVDNYIFKTLH
jgi:hypothetical protein